MKLKNKWKIYVIHHSHTDIGYTERQEKIIRYHYDFTKQAIDILNEIHKGNECKFKGFKWQCENYWQVENFLKNASPKYIEGFKKYVKNGEIGISGNYLNMTELIDYKVLTNKLKKSRDFGDKIGKKINCAMTADINGYAWGYSDALYENGIENLFSCLHPHHGMFPLYKKQIPFWWETTKGDRVLVWNGDHYQLGNELILVPNAGFSYELKDELGDRINTNQFEASKIRILRYLYNLEQEGYMYNFMPAMVSGVISDNAPPNADIAKRLNSLNEYFNGDIQFEMVTLEDFFNVVRAENQEIPIYKGDWNDWWADGIGSTPTVVKHFRDAQRKYDLCRKLDYDNNIGNKELIEEAEDNITLYAEHTWGYSSSVSEPWETLVNDLELKKSSFAINGHTAISKNLDIILANKGEVSIYSDREKRYRIINPHDITINDIVKIYLEYWEFVEDQTFNGDDNLVEIIDEVSGNILNSQTKIIARAREIEVLVNLDAKEERTIRVRRKKDTRNITIKNHAHVGAEGVEDIITDVHENNYVVNAHNIETKFYKIELDEEKGIRSIIDKIDNKELIRNDRKYDPLFGIYEITDIKTNPCEERRKMGRNRKNISTNRYTSVLKNIRVIENGKLYSLIEMSFSLEGTREYSITLKVYQDIPKITILAKIHKESRWEPENLYISLPFTTGEKEQLYIDKTGCIIRPGIDQLPGTNKEFYLLQNGMCYKGKSKSLILAIKDAPLISMGDLKNHQIELCNGKNYDFNKSLVYSWVMNNFWETNFKVDLGGFYQFEYNLYTIHEDIDKSAAIERCEALNEGLISFYI